MPRKPRDKIGEERKMKQLALRIPDDLHLKLKLKCVKERRSMMEVLTEAIRKYVES